MTNDEYARLQDMWLKATGVREGCWVKVLRAVKNHESGWGNSWAPEMDMLVGRTMQVKDVRSLQGIALGIDGDSSLFYAFPFFILEPTEAPKPEKYQFTPFEQVLVRDSDRAPWLPRFFSHMNKDCLYPFICISIAWSQCIPYAGHEHLLGTTDEPEDWEKYYDKE